jgi:histone-lysine N-methyltransferase SETMAR
MKAVNHPPYSPELNPCDFSLFPRLKEMFHGKTNTPSSLGSAMYQCLCQIPQDKYFGAFFQTGHMD